MQQELLCTIIYTLLSNWKQPVGIAIVCSKKIHITLLLYIGEGPMFLCYLPLYVTMETFQFVILPPPAVMDVINEGTIRTTRNLVGIETIIVI